MLKTKFSLRTLIVLGIIIGLILLAGVILFIKTPSVPELSIPVTGWQTDGTSTYYRLSDGSKTTGWQDIDGKTYYFHNSGIMATGWQTIEGTPYYFLENGQAASGTLIIGEKRHHFTTGGVPATGWFEYEGRHIFLDQTGTACTGWQRIYGMPYYFDEMGFPYSGWLEQNGKTYYLNPDGSAARGYHLIDGVVHYFASNGEKILLVNPWNHLPEDYTVNLKEIYEGHQVAAEAYPDLQQMLSDCEAAGCAPIVCSAYRSQEYQEMLYQRKIDRLMKTGMKRKQAEATAGTVVAIPGTSEHQLGLALDIIDDSNRTLDRSQENTQTQQWLMAHSWEYGWILRYPNGKTDLTGIIYEPWHYRYVGKEIAAELHSLDMCLEEYFNMLTNTVG